MKRERGKRRRRRKKEAKHVNILPYYVYLLMSTYSDENEGVIQIRSTLVEDFSLH